MPCIGWSEEDKRTKLWMLHQWTHKKRHCCILSVYEWILDLFDGAEAVGGGGGPIRNNSSM